MKNYGQLGTTQVLDCSTILPNLAQKNLMKLQICELNLPAILSHIEGEFLFRQRIYKSRH